MCVCVSLCVYDGSSSRAASTVNKEIALKEDALDKVHHGGVFVALPDGGALVYTLVGHSTAPRPVASIARDVPCKIAYTEALAVVNWLPRPQRFKATILRSSKSDPATVVQGAIGEYIDVPAGATREYDLAFYAYKEGSIHVDVVLQNEATQEYMVYDVVFTSLPSGPLDAIRLQTPVRTKAVHTIHLSNPLPQSTAFTMSCVMVHKAGDTTAPTVTKQSCSEIRGSANIKVPARSVDFAYEIQYLPLFAGEKHARLTLTSPELGAFTYDLTLTGTEAAPMSPVPFATELGGQVRKRVKFVNFTPVRTEFTATINGAGFRLAERKPLHTPGARESGSEVGVDVVCEPEGLGACKATLVLTSTVGGVYEIPLHGECAPPQPQGPFAVKSGGKVSLPLRNVTDSPAKYTVAIDNDMFTVGKAMEELKAREERDVVVAYAGSQDQVLRAARVLVTCTHGDCAGTEWIYYVQGIPN